MENQETSYKRHFKNFLIYPKFQYSLITINFLLFLMSGVYIFFFFKRSYGKLHLEGIAAGLPVGDIYFEQLIHQESVVQQSLVSALFISFVISSLFTVLMSHRMAGPIVRLKNLLVEGIKTGKLEPLIFRQDDFFPEFPEIFNQAMNKTDKNQNK